MKVLCEDFESKLISFDDDLEEVEEEVEEEEVLEAEDEDEEEEDRIPRPDVSYLEANLSVRKHSWSTFRPVSLRFADFEDQRSQSQ